MHARRFAEEPVAPIGVRRLLPQLEKAAPIMWLFQVAVQQRLVSGTRTEDSVGRYSLECKTDSPFQASPTIAIATRLLVARATAPGNFAAVEVRGRHAIKMLAEFREGGGSTTHTIHALTAALH